MDTTQVVHVLSKPEWYVPIIQLAMFSVFIHAIIEVVRGVSASGIWGIIKEVLSTLWKQSPLSDSTIHTLVFVLAIVFCKVFDYGVMTDMLGIEKVGKLVDWLDFIGTASVVYVGVDVFYAQLQKIRGAMMNGGNKA